MKSKGRKDAAKKKAGHHVLRLSAFAVIFFIFSCKKDSPAPDLGYAYFPDNVGHYVIYQVDSTAQDDRVNSDTTYRYQVKEVIQSIYYDNSGRPTMRIERYRKNYDPNVPYSAQQWTGPRVYAANLTKTTGERLEENFRYTRLTFPVKLGTKWNANANNTLEAWDSRFTSIDQPEVVNGFSFDSVATVEEENEINLVETKYAEAKYAKHVGLVYRRLMLLNKQPQFSNDTIPFNDTLGLPSYSLLSQKAILLTQRVIGWGD
jgi:hypothetical protein